MAGSYQPRGGAYCEAEQQDHGNGDTHGDDAGVAGSRGKAQIAARPNKTPHPVAGWGDW